MLEEVGRRIAAGDDGGALRRSSDFIVFAAEHDEGWEEKFASARACNPASVVAEWERRGWMTDPYSSLR